MKPGNSEQSGQMAPQLIKHYLNGSLSLEENRYVEETISDDDAWGDALEGLKLLEEEVPAEQAEREIHHYLRHRLGKKRKSRLSAIQFPIWLILAVAVILLSMVAVVVLLQWL